MALAAQQDLLAGRYAAGAREAVRQRDGDLLRLVRLRGHFVLSVGVGVVRALAPAHLRGLDACQRGTDEVVEVCLG